MNKLLILPILLTANILSTTMVHATESQQETINTAEGYPYKNLIMWADKVELIYSNNNENTICRVNVLSDNLTHKGINRTVSNNKFKKTPMAACLTRDTAKQLLTKL
ncbi:hypothetical protein [Pseudoalteromonas sp. MMG012]|uniref:hypothetical protein n=1 Tax=Pseudoalteromonas sp. MMG012 TaxID=2822686 RepID=UPI001B39FEE7|nr:hypothetical protein [Pseudoalteromonas sp. MMG012]MBQ4852011.1 hypothetical protein [Pseudoalteromonas sp. MMG012]